MKHLACLALLAALATGAAHANRPLNTDTADTIAARRCQFEPYAGTNRSDGAPTEHFWLLQLNCGVSGNTQLGASLARDWAGSDNSRSAAFGGKTNLVELKGGQTGFALGYGLSALHANGAGWRSEGALLNGIASRELAEGWLVHANLGWAHSRSAHQNSTTFGLATEVTLREGVVASAEFYGDDHQRPWLAAGLLWQPADNLSVNVSYGVQSSSPRVRQATLGFLVEF